MPAHFYLAVPGRAELNPSGERPSLEFDSLLRDCPSIRVQQSKLQMRAGIALRLERFRYLHSVFSFVFLSHWRQQQSQFVVRFDRLWIQADGFLETVFRLGTPVRTHGQAAQGLI
jgi:hypothetical protein